MKGLTRQRWEAFKRHRMGWNSLRIFILLFVTACCANLVCNDRPLIAYCQGKVFVPLLKYYPETEFGGQFDLETNYLGDDFARFMKQKKGWALWPPIRYAVSTINTKLEVSAPSPPSWKNLLGTDDQGRDVLTRLIYGLRTSLLFGLIFAFLSGLLGTIAGALQGYFGGWVDLTLQRIVEVWSGLPTLFMLMIFANFVQPSFFTLVAIMVFFSWTTLVYIVRAEFLRARQNTYVTAARVLGVRPLTIALRHILPNVITSSLSYFPFLVSYSISTLTALDFLGLGLPSGSASLGELLQQARANLYAPWLGITSFLALALILVLITFIGEGLRSALLPSSRGTTATL
jgi:microcin C transport system permease protein